MRKANLYKRFAWILGVFVSMLCIVVIVALYIGEWLHNDDSLVKADAIIVLGGNPSRAYQAADIYNQGYASHIYLSVAQRTHTETLLDETGIFMPREEEINRQVLIMKGVPASNIITIVRPVVSTADEADEVRSMINSDNCRIIVVTSPYHVRRTKMIFRDIVKGCDVRVVGTSYEPYPSKWWQDKELAGQIILEGYKIPFYAFGGRFKQ